MKEFFDKTYAVFNALLSTFKLYEGINGILGIFMRQNSIVSVFFDLRPDLPASFRSLDVGIGYTTVVSAFCVRARKMKGKIP